MKMILIPAVIILIVTASCGNAVLISPEKNNIHKHSGFTIQADVNPPGSGVITLMPEEESYVRGDVVDILCAPEEGYLFSRWAGDSSSTDKHIEITVDGDISLTAFFTKTKWLFMIYMSGDNDLEPRLIEDINEMECTDLGGEGIDIIVLADRSPGFDASNGNWTDTRLYRILYDPSGFNIGIVSERIAGEELGITSGGRTELNMGSPAVLSGFINFCTETYPAENYALVLWGHGTGWRSNNDRGFRAAVFDDSSGGDPLYTMEIGNALKEGQADIVFFDLCSGGMLETAWEIRNSASLMIASEGRAPADGLEYDDFFGRLTKVDPDADIIASAAANSYSTSYNDTPGTSISAVDLAGIEDLMTALNSFSDALSSVCSDRVIANEIKDILFNDTESFISVPGDMNLDIRDMAERISGNTDYADTEAAALTAAIDQAVLYNWTNPAGNPGARGLAVHFIPLDSSGRPVPHDNGYFRGRSTDFPISFTGSSTWVPAEDGGGLLYKLWY